MNNDIVSFDDEMLICVDENDTVTGYMSKDECHDGEAILHRAFSIFIFNDHNELLMQKRSDDKRLWPLYWSNSCCSHPRKGESMDLATERRLQEELGLSSDLHYLYKFQYHASFGDAGSEREVCSVYIGRQTDDLNINPNEIAEWKYIAPDDLEMDMQENPEKYTPWFHMEWKRIREEYWDQVLSL
ncbi:MAG: isopentenyl-diphosphate Delta-isomerase [Candidatus Marinimicrobia bacterium]|nr:isopentenyl-diphosphate Delta-isomerase [Candidatus Neomarinimicrobiota bacterium]MCF7880559.1 isopentenyl-diphosphate Delta-isomerase [Candidatus Neomarinimicrobiota bacterium]